MSNALERLRDALNGSEILFGPKAIMAKADLALLLAVYNAAETFAKLTEANFDFPELEKIKDAVSALTKNTGAT